MSEKPPEAERRAVRAAIGILIDSAAATPRVLLAQRRKGQQLADLWEYPGGKIEAGETPAEALVREFAEELGIDIVVGEALDPIVHDYEHARVVLLPFWCTWKGGMIRDAQVAAHRWADADELLKLPTPPANAPIHAAVAHRLT